MYNGTIGLILGDEIPEIYDLFFKNLCDAFLRRITDALSCGFRCSRFF